MRTISLASLRQAAKWLSVPRVLALAFAAIACVLAVASLRWRMQHDSPIMLYIAFLMDRYGAVPYRDIFDINMPGTYLIYSLLGRSLGYSDLAFRTGDLIYLCGITVVTWAAMKTFSRGTALAAAALFACYYFSEGPSTSMQREYLLLLPISLLLMLAVSRPAMNERLRWFLLGLLSGLCFLIKPHALVALPVVVVYRACHLRAAAAAPRRLAVPALLLLVGLALPVGGAAVWLSKAGALHPFLDIATQYWPLYGGLSGNHELLKGAEHTQYLAGSLATLSGSNHVLLAAGALGFVFALRVTTGKAADRRRVLLLGALAGVFAIYPVFAGMFWPYHWLVCTYFALCLASLVFLPVEGRKILSERASSMQYGAIALLVVFGVSSLPRPLVEAAHPERVAAPKGGRVDAMAGFLARNLRPTDTVQPLDWTGGAVHAMLIARARLATSFIYDFPFYHHVSMPYIAGLRTRFLHELQLSNPRFIVEVTASDKPWPRGADTSADFPPLRLYLQDHYRIAEKDEGMGYVIYERLRGP